MIEALAGGRIQDQGGARTLLDLGVQTGLLEVAFDGLGGADLSGSAGVHGVKFFAPRSPSAVTHAGAAVSFTWDEDSGLVTVE
jgi:hypothetical protein